jgi:hypothetical protein
LQHTAKKTALAGTVIAQGRSSASPKVDAQLSIVRIARNKICPDWK